MAKRTILVDDFDGSENDVATQLFALNGEMFEIDLSPANVMGLREALAPYIAAGRSRGVRQARKSKSKTPRSDRNPEHTAMRTWAGEHGFEINKRGRIPEHVAEAYRAAVHTNGAQEGE